MVSRGQAPGVYQLVYQFTRSHNHRTISIDYKINAEGFHSKDEQNIAIAESSALSLDEGPASVNMARTSDNLVQMVGQK